MFKSLFGSFVAQFEEILIKTAPSWHERLLERYKRESSTLSSSFRRHDLDTYPALSKLQKSGFFFLFV